MERDTAIAADDHSADHAAAQEPSSVKSRVRVGLDGAVRTPGPHPSPACRASSAGPARTRAHGLFVAARGAVHGRVTRTYHRLNAALKARAEALSAG